MSITEFNGKYEFLSMYYHKDQTTGVMFSFYDEQENLKTDIHYLSFPNADLAFKAYSISNKDIQEKIANLSPNNSAFDVMNDKENPINPKPGWNDKKKYDSMYLILRDKFSEKNIGMKLALLGTGDDLIIYSKSQKENEDSFWVKDNNLGKILMRIRREITNDDGDFEYCISNYLIRQGLHEIKPFLNLPTFNDD